MEIKKIKSDDINWIIPNKSAKYEKIKQWIKNAKIGEAIEIKMDKKPCHKFYYCTILLQSFRKERCDFDIRTKTLNNEGTIIALMKVKREE